MSVYIFCDNSNVFIEGQWAAGRADGLRGPNIEFRIDYGQLLTVCAGGREVVQAKLYGSVPPPNDSLWKGDGEAGVGCQDDPKEPGRQGKRAGH